VEALAEAAVSVSVSVSAAVCLCRDIKEKLGMKKKMKDYTTKKRIPAGVIILSLIMMTSIVFSQGDLYARKVNCDTSMYNPSTKTCNRFYCHSNGKESFRPIVWKKGQNLNCQSCHDSPPKYDDVHGDVHGDVQADQKMNTCGQSCHTQTIKNRVTTNSHINGKIDGEGAEERKCTTCHINSTGPGAPRATGFDMLIKHTKGRPTDKDCMVCHMEEFQEYHKNQKVELKNHSGGPFYSPDQYNQFCLSCHASGSSLMGNTPFDSKGPIPSIHNELISKKNNNGTAKFWYPHNHMAKAKQGYNVGQMINESGPNSRLNFMSPLSRHRLTTDSTEETEIIEETENTEDTKDTEDTKKTEDKPSSTYNNYNVRSISTTYSTRLKAGIMGGGGESGMTVLSVTSLAAPITMGMAGVAGVAQVPAFIPAFATPLTMGGGGGMLGGVAPLGGGIMTGGGPVLSVLGGGGMMVDPLGGMRMDPSRMGGPLSMVTMTPGGLQSLMMGILTNPMLGMPNPMLGMPVPMMGMPVPMMGMPGPMMGMPGPMMGMPVPMMGMPVPMMGMPGPMMGMPGPMMGMPGPMMGMPGPMMGMPGPMMDTKIDKQVMDPGMNNMPGTNNMPGQTSPTDPSDNNNDNETMNCLECHAYENQDYSSSYIIENNFHGHFSHQDCRACHTYHGSQDPGLLKDGINWNSSNRSCSNNIGCHPAPKHESPLSGTMIFYHLKPEATCNNSSCH
jgi:predicted CxxxxCH...CXXCH cytochrome family protein